MIAVYQSEIAHPSIRGRVTALQQFMLGIGAFVAGWVSWGCFINLTNEGQWRIPLGIQILPALALAALILLFPESPRWLVDHDRADEGLATLARLHSNGDINDTWVQAEFASIKDTVSFEREHEAKSYTELFTNPYVTYSHHCISLNLPMCMNCRCLPIFTWTVPLSAAYS